MTCPKCRSLRIRPHEVNGFPSESLMGERLYFCVDCGLTFTPSTIHKPAEVEKPKRKGKR